MNLFTSVFRLTETRVAVCLVLFLLALEGFFRVSGARLSADAVKIEKIAEVAAKLHLASPPRVLMLGNSILAAGVDTARLQAGMNVEQEARDWAVEAVTPDSSHVTIWDYLYSRYFVGPDQAPEELVLVTGRMHLVDAPANLSHLAAYYVANRDLGRFFAEDTQSLEQRLEFLLGRWYAPMRFRQRVSPRVFDVLLPNYQENWHILNQASLNTPLAVRKHEGDEAATTRHLGHLLNLAREKGTRVTVVLAPMPKPYELHPAVQLKLEEAGVRVVDVNPVPGLGEAHFADADHLNEAGKELFTEALIPALAKVLSIP
jgi:hypothetical protein